MASNSSQTWLPDYVLETDPDWLLDSTVHYTHHVPPSLATTLTKAVYPFDCLMNFTMKAHTEGMGDSENCKDTEVIHTLVNELLNAVEMTMANPASSSAPVEPLDVADWLLTLRGRDHLCLAKAPAAPARFAVRDLVRAAHQSDNDYRRHMAQLYVRLGLLPAPDAHRCPVHAHSSLYFDARNPRGYLVCRQGARHMRCRWRRALTEGSVIFHRIETHMDLTSFLIFLYSESQGCSYMDVQRAVGRFGATDLSPKTVTKWRAVLNEAKAHFMQQIWLAHGPVGGLGRVVLVEESAFGCGRVMLGQGMIKHWICAFLEKDTDEVRLVVCPMKQRNVQKLTDLIRRHVRVGSVVCADSLPSDCALWSEGYVQQCPLPKDLERGLGRRRQFWQPTTVFEKQNKLPRRDFPSHLFGLAFDQLCKSRKIEPFDGLILAIRHMYVFQIPKTGEKPEQDQNQPVDQNKKPARQKRKAADEGGETKKPASESKPGFPKQHPEVTPTEERILAFSKRQGKMCRKVNAVTASSAQTISDQAVLDHVLAGIDLTLLVGEGNDLTNRTPSSSKNA